jgi:hypothetical protein
MVVRAHEITQMLRTETATEGRYEKMGPMGLMGLTLAGP